MKTILLSINSKFIHTLLAPRYLLANTECENVSIYETNINIPLKDVLKDIYKLSPDVIAISCYIFNIAYVDSFLAEIKRFLPNVKIILGGYEVTSKTEKYSQMCDVIIEGEGDFTFNEVLKQIYSGESNLPKIVKSLPISRLNDIKSPFDDEYCKLGKSKILYYESSRGCPFNCAYCMSGGSDGVRTFTMDRIQSDLKKILEYSPKQIKFVDRTFNYNVPRAYEIMQFIIDNFNDKQTNFHFELAPELFSERLFSIIAKAKKGLFQFEIGVQSYNQQALDSVNRKAKIELLESNIKKLLAIKNSHVHVDLIAGLPYEDYKSFINGFNRLISLKPDCLQLGFLKILPGSQMESMQGYTTYYAPPYEIINSKWLSFEQIVELKKAEEMLEIFYNSERFKLSIEYILSNTTSPFAIFLSIGNYLEAQNKTYRQISSHHTCDLLYDCMESLKLIGEIDIDLEQLEMLIQSDYKNSGNVRTWRKKI